MSTTKTTTTDLSDWRQPEFGEKDTAQRRRILTSSRVTTDGNTAAGGSSTSSITYSVSASRTAYRDAISAPAESLPRPAPERKNRSMGGTWQTSPGLFAALHQSNTTIRDYEPVQRNIEKKVVVEKIQQPKQLPQDVAEKTVVRLSGMRVRGVGQR